LFILHRFTPSLAHFSTIVHFSFSAPSNAGSINSFPKLKSRPRRSRLGQTGLPGGVAGGWSSGGCDACGAGDDAGSGVGTSSTNGGGGAVGGTDGCGAGSAGGGTGGAGGKVSIILFNLSHGVKHSLYIQCFVAKFALFTRPGSSGHQVRGLKKRNPETSVSAYAKTRATTVTFIPLPLPSPDRIESCYLKLGFRL
jgi:hypothetical protein